MKNKFPILLLVLLSLFLLTACHSSADKAENNKTEEAAKKDTSLPGDSSVSPKDQKGTATSNDSYQNTSDIDTESASDAPLERPASLGAWISSMRFSAVDDSYHTVYYRIKSVSFADDNEEASKLLEDYNNAGHTVSFPKKNNKALDYCIIMYDVAFPKDFPESEDGIMNADLPFKIVNFKGADYTYEKNNKIRNFSRVYDISDPIASGQLHPNDIYRSGVAVFELPDKQKDYLISSTYYLGATAFTTYVTPFSGDEE